MFNIHSIPSDNLSCLLAIKYFLIVKYAIHGNPIVELQGNDDLVIVILYDKIKMKKQEQHARFVI